MSESDALTLVHFSADRWEHVCPVIRATTPSLKSGIYHLRGSERQGGEMQIYPERIAQAEVVLVQRDFPRFALAYDQVMDQAREQGKPVVYELDDMLFDLPEIHPDYERYLGVQLPVLEAAASADAVICTTPVLQQHLLEINPRVYVWPNYLDDDLWQLRPPGTADESRPLVIGYLGSHSHQPDLDSILPVLESLLLRYSDRLLLRLWGMQTPEALSRFPNVESVVVGMVDYAAFARYFNQQELDIAIAPLLDSPFNRAKSAIKFLEYGALGAPGVYSQVTPYASVVKHAESGLLAGSTEEWQAALEQLIESPELRSRIGTAAQEQVRRDWLLSEHAGEWARIIREISETGPVSASSQAHSLNRRFLSLHRKSQAQLERLQDENQQLHRVQEQYVHSRQSLDAIVQTPGWKLMEALNAWRKKIAPKYSRREKVIYTSFYALRGANRRAVGLLRRVSGADRKKGRGIFQPPASAPVPVSFRMVEAQLASLPAVCVVLEKNVLLPELPEQALLEWLDRQTLQAVEAVVWDRSDGTARILRSEPREWQAPNLAELTDGLGAAYLCLASADLLCQPAVYLEANWIALESAGLAFTLNVNGRSDWPVRHLHRGILPGARVLPLHRMVVRREFVQKDFSLDFSGWFPRQAGHPGLIGRVLHHTTANPDDERTIPFEIRFRGVEIFPSDPYLMARSDSSIPWRVPVEPLRSPRQFWSAGAEPDSRPTIFLLQPFLALGGAEDLALNIISFLKERARFVVIGADPLSPELGTTAEAYRRLTPYVYNLPDFLELHLRLDFLIQLIERFQPVTFYIHNGSPWIYDVLPEIKKRYPGLYTVNQVYDSQIGWINRYNQELVAALDASIGTNQKIVNAYIQKGVRPEKAVQVEHGILADGFDPQEYPPVRIARLRAQFGLQDGQRAVTFASRLHPQKRPLDFLELARRLKEEPSIVFLLFGDGPLAGVVDEQITALGLENIRRHPFYRPVSDVLAVSDALVLPSEYEGMPLILSQAQLMGVPGVVTDVGNNAEVLSATGGGVVAPVGDVGGLVRGVLAVLAQKPDPQRMRRELLANYGMDVIAEKYWSALVPER
jgi:glycosyltransferase involved in cell wall biosynthesis